MPARADLLPTTFRLTGREIDALEAEVQASGLDRSEIVRRAIDLYLGLLPPLPHPSRPIAPAITGVRAP